MKRLAIIYVVFVSTNMIVIILQGRDKYMNRIYIIGSLSQSSQICEVAQKIKKEK